MRLEPGVGGRDDGPGTGQGWCGAAAQSVLTIGTKYERECVWDLRKVGRAKDCEWVTSSVARLGLGSQVCRAALSSTEQH
jgi:hypothetical protein